MGQRRVGKRLGLPVAQPGAQLTRPIVGKLSEHRWRGQDGPARLDPRDAGKAEPLPRFSREDRDHQRSVAGGDQLGRPQRPIGRMDPGRQAAGSVPHHDGLVLGKQAGTESQRQRKPDACDGANHYQWNPRGERPSRAGPDEPEEQPHAAVRSSISLPRSNLSTRSDAADTEGS